MDLTCYSYNNQGEPQMCLIDPLDTLDFQRLLFIFNAVMNGWTVKQLDGNRYEFEKDLAQVPNKYKTRDGLDVKDTFLFKFLRNNLSLQSRYNGNASISND